MISYTSKPLVTLWNEDAREAIVAPGQIITVEATKVQVYQQKISCSGGTLTEYKEEDRSNALASWWVETDHHDLPTISKVVSRNFNLYSLTTTPQSECDDIPERIRSPEK